MTLPQYIAASTAAMIVVLALVARALKRKRLDRRCAKRVGDVKRRRDVANLMNRTQ